MAETVDTDSGQAVARFTVRESGWEPKYLWLGESEALEFDDEGMHRLDVFKGRKLATLRQIERGPAYVDESGRSLWSIGGGLKSNTVTATQIDLRTGARSKTAHGTLPAITGNLRGLVPDGKHLYMAASGLHIHDRQTLALRL